MPREIGLLLFDRTDDVATSSSPSFDDDYKQFFRAGKDGYSVLRRPVTFDAGVDPKFDAAWAVDEDEERRLDDEKKFWFKERVAGRDEDDQNPEQGGGGGGTES